MHKNLWVVLDGSAMGLPAGGKCLAAQASRPIYYSRRIDLAPAELCRFQLTTAGVFRRTNA
jgi:hypothetical protein